LLGRDDPSPIFVTNPDGRSPYLIIGDHAGRAIPSALGDLGLPPEAMDRHIAWDIGVAGLGDLLAGALDACFIRQSYSRLVIDCNRGPASPDASPAVSDGTVIPGNQDLAPVDAAMRRREICDPYQAAIADVLDARRDRGQATLLFSLHSFTPVFAGLVRPWRFGVLHRGDSALSTRMLALLRDQLGDAAGDNQPYAMDGIDYTVPLHADARGLDYLELEVRQDLIGDEPGQREIATFLVPILRAALAPD
jgi:predicted N-formylglutamate amidohydrolase